MADNQWANFVRNHDELTLDKLSDSERQEVFAAFGPDEGMQLFGRGIRRRLPSMLDGDRARIELVYSLMFSLPGTPVLFYGEEVGMAENLDIPGRMSVRTPMQWSREANGGFSTAGKDKLRMPLVEGERFGPEALNVAAQRRDPDSLLNWMERLIRRRKETPELGWGRWALVPAAEPALFAHRCDWEGGTVIAVHNLSSEPRTLTLSLDDEWEALVDLLGRRDDLTPSGGAAPEVELPGYGYRWLRLRRPGQRIAP